MKTITKTIRLFSRRGKYGIASTAFLASVVALPVLVWAAPNTQLSQIIGAGTLVTDIRDENGASVANPTAAFNQVPFPFECLVGGARPQATLGTNTQRLYVDNPGAANNGWTLTIAADDATSTWVGTNSGEQYDYNDPTSDGTNNGCADGADTDTVAGQMTIDPSVATLTPEGGATNTSITQGSSAAFEQGVNGDSITLLNAASGSDDYGRWYLTGVDLRQTIPQEQAADTYNLDLTLTVTAQ